MRQINVTFTNAMGPVTNGYKVTPGVWKYNDEIKVNGGTVWATMDTRRNKGFEDSTTTSRAMGRVGQHGRSRTAGDGSTPATNMLQMWGDSGIYQEWDIVPFGRYTFSAWLRNNNDDPLRDGAGGYLQIEWYGKDGRYLGSSESAHLRTNTPGNAWVRYAVDDLAPSNSWMMRRLIRMGPDNLLANGQLTGTGLAPTGWSQWGERVHDPCTEVYRGHVRQLLAVLVGRRDLPGRDHGLRRGRYSSSSAAISTRRPATACATAPSTARSRWSSTTAPR